MTDEKKAFPVKERPTTTQQEHFTMNRNHFNIPSGENNSPRFILPLAGKMADNERLSKLISGQASRYLLAFFVPDNRLASQSNDTESTKPLTQITGLNRHILDTPKLGRIANYDGMTLQNKIAERRICRAVSNKTESKSHHPMFFHSVVITQNLLGGYHA